MKRFRHFWRYLAKLFPEWEMFLDKSCRENQNTHFMFSTFFPENRTVYEVMSKNIVETEAPQMTQHGAYALHAGLAKLYASMRRNRPTRPGTHMHANMRTQTNK
jgi:hypothetical protein